MHVDPHGFENGEALMIRTNGHHDVKVGDSVHVHILGAECHLFHGKTGVSFERAERVSRQ